MILINGALVAWKSKKQGAVALSTAEAEYAAVVEAVKEALGNQECLQELGFKVREPLTIFCDNTAAIAQIRSESTSAKTKHMDIRLKFIQDLCRKEKIEITHVDTKLQLADMMTKGFASTRLEELKKLLRMN